MNDEYDQASQAFQHNLQRSNLFDFSVDVVHIRLHYVMDIGRASKPDWTLYMRPFHMDTWFGYCHSTMVVVVMLSCYSYCFS